VGSSNLKELKRANESGSCSAQVKAPINPNMQITKLSRLNRKKNAELRALRFWTNPLSYQTENCSGQAGPGGLFG
jgi:hypothetical protein